MDIVIEKVFNNIYRTLSRTNAFSSSSLYNGLAGWDLFLYEYGKYTNSKEVNKLFEREISTLSEKMFETRNFEFCNGRTGIQWLFSFLYKKNIIFFEDKKILCDDNDDKLKEVSNNWILSGNFDFLYGSLGIQYYLLYNLLDNNIEYEFFEQFIDSLITNQVSSIYGNFIPNPLGYESREYENIINLGLAHGMPSVLKVLLEGYKKGIKKNLCQKIAYNIIDCILLCKNEDASISYFPSSKDIHNKKDVPSRLAWCYGDLGATFVLYQAAKIFDDKYLEDLALQILEKTTKRKTDEETGLKDFGICHGVAGVVHIYHKLWKQTNLQIFKDAQEFWISKLMQPAVGNNFAPYFQKYFNPDKKYVDNYSLLEGAVGIGLVLLSYITGDTDWDYCLMLNE